MATMRRIVLTAVALSFAAIIPVAAQDRELVIDDLVREVGTVETKIIGLARTMPDSAYDWRPSKTVRSTREVFIHVAADNYFMPVLMGAAAPADTGINIEGRSATVAAFEKRSMTRDEIVTHLERSFKFLKQAMEATTSVELDKQAKFERRKMTSRAFWIRSTTHLHEHLGQLIAYARSNEVTPPWSK